MTTTGAGFGAGLTVSALALVRRTEVVLDSAGGEVFFFRMSLPWGAVALSAVFEAGVAAADLAAGAGFPLLGIWDKTVKGWTESGRVAGWFLGTQTGQGAGVVMRRPAPCNQNSGGVLELTTL